ncbi:MAG: L-threonylcarbamoyladenylate synthase [Acidobacteriota bacterium]
MKSEIQLAPDVIREAAQLLREGKIVAFPTETVYGLGANALDASAVQRVFELKGRPSTSPLIVHVASVEAAREVVSEWPPLAEQLARRFWPGPLTLVLPKQASIPDIVTAGLDTVGVRVPAHPIALALLREAKVPVAAPSANRFMGVSPTTAEHVRAAFVDAVPVLDGGPCQVGIESTVVAISGEVVTLLRPGMISLADLRAATHSRVVVPDAVASAGDAHASPGLHHRHYSPSTPLFLTDGRGPLHAGTGAYVWHRTPNPSGQSIKMSDDPERYAAQLYAALHTLDSKGLDWIAVEEPPDTPEWSAIRDRLKRAAGLAYGPG